MTYSHEHIIFLLSTVLKEHNDVAAQTSACAGCKNSAVRFETCRMKTLVSGQLTWFQRVNRSYLSAKGKDLMCWWNNLLELFLWAHECHNFCRRAHENCYISVSNCTISANLTTSKLKYWAFFPANEQKKTILSFFKRCRENKNCF